MFKLITLLPLVLAAASSVCQPGYESAHALQKAHRTILRSARNPSRRRLPGDDCPLQQGNPPVDVESQVILEEKSKSDMELENQKEESNDHVATPYWSTNRKLAVLLSVLAVPTAFWGLGKLINLPWSNQDGKDIAEENPTRINQYLSHFSLGPDLSSLSEEQHKELRTLQDDIEKIPNSCVFANNGGCDDGVLCKSGTDCNDCGTCWVVKDYFVRRAIKILNPEGKGTVQELSTRRGRLDNHEYEGNVLDWMYATNGAEDEGGEDNSNPEEHEVEGST